MEQLLVPAVLLGLLLFGLILMPLIAGLTRLLPRSRSDIVFGAIISSFLAFSLPFLGRLFLPSGEGYGPGNGIGEIMVLAICFMMSGLMIPLSLLWFFRCSNNRNRSDQ
ncbi:hypothetical protein JQV19_01510 [Sulfitobacter mediterraneus]|uniref:hypothetical protein n=1 Tax=Sulfitobacter mediterraneus TaxID=83219 RepID=UPI00193ADCCF|nr:hypothetical protein [Sulfitobacter mediterraneus]MBM1555587.1 hypothetical protein [Sulfitobacter mediterraneus]MBM1566860.1 hypothetical protein [Sulfitobacter mediterraneus]MBM1570662.1 hypothetical protein [Sulfitobacter mediterraneus]MBM1574462.1 hypothetical protein [Sulfitobacter mediterraneus]MBM1578545.1 hypothetical protein [Sulfitobacter mediterraneus]